MSLSSRFNFSNFLNIFSLFVLINIASLEISNIVWVAAVMAAVMAPVMGTGAVRLPTVRGVKEFYRATPIILPKEAKKGHGFHE